MSIRVNVDPTNPGQFFACCGLLELADRLWSRAEGWFEGEEFCVESGGTLDELVHCLTSAKLIQSDLDDNTGSPVELRASFGSLLLDWWHDDRAGGKELKVWAGTMESARIAQAMQFAMSKDDRFHSSELFDVGLIAYSLDDPEKKVEPYYFDSRRGPNAHSRDVGFSPNDLQMTTTAFPAVELLCLIGLQRCYPKLHRYRVYDFYTWRQPISPELLPPVVTGILSLPGTRGYRFENWYRTGQKKHKAFRSAIPLSPGV